MLTAEIRLRASSILKQRSLQMVDVFRLFLRYNVIHLDARVIPGGARCEVLQIVLESIRCYFPGAAESAMLSASAFSRYWTQVV